MAVLAKYSFTTRFFLVVGIKHARHFCFVCGSCVYGLLVKGRSSVFKLLLSVGDAILFGDSIKACLSSSHLILILVFEFPFPLSYFSSVMAHDNRLSFHSFFV